MISVSNEYKTAVYAQERAAKAKLIFKFVDIDADIDATPTVTSEASVSEKTQLFNNVRDTKYKYATLENDYWKLDGSFGLTPKPAETGYEIGWWSDLLSGVGGTYSTAQVLTISFSKDHSSIGTTITFDTIVNEYASDFTIVYKDSGGSTLHTATITGNTLTEYILAQNVSNFRSIVITITKWKISNRRVRILEIDFGIIETYDGEKLINFDVLEELDTISNTVTSNEIKFTIDNQNKAFNIINPDGLVPYLQRKQKIYPYIGITKADLVTEYVSMGIFYLKEWLSNEGTMTASFVARDILDTLSDDTFASTSYTSKTLKYIIDDIMTKASITDYTVDSALTSVTTTGTLPESTYREALQTVCIAGMAVIYVDRNGTIQIKQLSTTASIDTIDFDNIYASPAIKLDKLINTINVKYGASTYTLTDPDKVAGEQIVLVEINNPLVSTLTMATNVAAWMLAEFKKRFIYDISWRQNPALECGDIVTIEDDFSENKTARIIRQEFNFAGYLGGKTSAKGGGT